jgi:predicted ATPase/class 3 adenylate cyclase
MVEVVEAPCQADLVSAPSGTVTFLFTDIEGSTRLWEIAPEAMRSALERHDMILDQAMGRHQGYVFATGGDGFAAAFTRAGDALGAAREAAADLAMERWPPEAGIRVRMALHTAEAVERDGDYFGPGVNRAARILAIAHGGQILCSQATAGIIGSVDLVSLGAHRLRDLDVPEVVFQVGQGSFPPLRSLGTRPTNLPVQRTSFVGRDHELKTTLAALDQSSLVTLTGVGGVGKTRLALEAASHLLVGLADGAWLVELAPVADPDAVVEVTASALGILPRPGQAPLDAVIAYLRPRRLLLVIDNCEHLLDAVASLIDRVLGSCPDVRILATSREALAIEGEHAVPVPALGLPTGDQDDASDALRLLIERALAVRPDFALTAATRSALVEICRRVDGIPLAIELAAARLRSMTPEELAARLDQRFRVLVGSRRVALNRHQTLRSTIDWSYDLLDETERSTFQRVAVFAGGFDLSAAEAVCDDLDCDVIDSLAHLVDKSLVTAEAVGPVTRYRMLETIRDYALERLSTGEQADAVRRSHALYFAGWSTEAGAGLRGPHEASWLDIVERETENLRSALLWAIDAGEVDVAMSIVAPLMLEVLPIDDTVGNLAELCLTAPGAREHPSYAQVAAFAAYTQAWRGALEAGRALLADAHEVMARARPSALTLVRVLASEMITAVLLSGHSEAVKVAERRVEAARASRDDYELCRALAGLSSLRGFVAGDMLGPAQAAADIARRTGNPLLLSSSLYALAQATVPLDRETAIGLLQESESLATGNVRLLTVVQQLQARLLMSVEDLAGVAEIALRAVEIDWSHRRRLNYSAASVEVLAEGLAAGGWDEAAGLLAGACSRYMNIRDSNFPLLEELASRLGPEGYAALLARGAAMEDSEMLDYVRALTADIRAASITDAG